jgi:hypothetical protein
MPPEFLDESTGGRGWSLSGMEWGCIEDETGCEVCNTVKLVAGSAIPQQLRQGLENIVNLGPCRRMERLEKT